MVEGRGLKPEDMQHGEVRLTMSSLAAVNCGDLPKVTSPAKYILLPGSQMVCFYDASQGQLNSWNL